MTLDPKAPYFPSPQFLTKDTCPLHPAQTASQLRGEVGHHDILLVM